MSYYIQSSRNNSSAFLLTMVQSLQPIISSMIPYVKAENAKQQIAILGKAEVSVPKVNPKQEYFIYVQRFGPPNEGIFDESALNQIRKELGKPVSAPTYNTNDGRVHSPETDS